MAAGLVDDAELGEQVADMALDRPLGQPEPTGNPGVGQPLGHQREHLLLALGQSREHTRVAVGGDQLAHNLRVQGRPAARYPLERLQEVIDVESTSSYGHHR